MFKISMYYSGTNSMVAGLVRTFFMRAQRPVSAPAGVSGASYGSREGGPGDLETQGERASLRGSMVSTVPLCNFLGS